MSAYDNLIKIDKLPNVLLATIENTSEYDSAPSFGLVDISEIIPLLKVCSDFLDNDPTEGRLQAVTFSVNPVLSFLGYREHHADLSILDEDEREKHIEAFLVGDDTKYALYDNNIHRYSIDPSDFSDNIWCFDCLVIDKARVHIKWYGKYSNDEIYITIDKKDLVL